MQRSFATKIDVGMPFSLLSPHLSHPSPIPSSRLPSPEQLGGLGEHCKQPPSGDWGSEPQLLTNLVSFRQKMSGAIKISHICIKQCGNGVPMAKIGLGTLFPSVPTGNEPCVYVYVMGGSGEHFEFVYLNLICALSSHMDAGWGKQGRLIREWADYVKERCEMGRCS